MLRKCPSCCMIIARYNYEARRIVYGTALWHCLNVAMKALSILVMKHADLAWKEVSLPMLTMEKRRGNYSWRKVKEKDGYTENSLSLTELIDELSKMTTPLTCFDSMGTYQTRILCCLHFPFRNISWSAIGKPGDIDVTEASRRKALSPCIICEKPFKKQDSCPQ